MLWAIDIGNSAVKVGEETEAGLRLAASRPTADVARDPQALFEPIGSRPDFVAIASVVPEVAKQVEGALHRSGIPCRRLSAESAPGLEIGYETPSTLGADRIANALWLQDRGALPAACVDFGTATKIDVVDASGAYLGGAILPSPQMMMEALAGGAVQLEPVNLRVPEKAIGRSTEGSLLAGTVLALGKAIDGLLAAMEEEIGAKLDVVATGGLAERFASASVRCRQRETLVTLGGLLVASRRWAG